MSEIGLASLRDMNKDVKTMNNTDSVTDQMMIERMISMES